MSHLSPRRTPCAESSTRPTTRSTGHHVRPPGGLGGDVMKTVVWVASILLALTFVAVGGMKVLTSTADLQQSAMGVPVVLLKVAGTAELLGALGLILPAATRIMPMLTPLAAAALTVTMVGATIVNIAVGAYSALPMTVVLALVSALVGWARFGRYTIEPRSQTVAAAADTAQRPSPRRPRERPGRNALSAP
ncbi:MAG: DoxX family membrane protein [Pseudonocardiaceae bacterium]|nr:DoxX family membrane protein [Pseudonocardiaceae bacterium]